jgi:hypothetical protein
MIASIVSFHMVVVQVIKTILFPRRIIEISSRDVFASMREQERREEELKRGRFFSFLFKWFIPSQVVLRQDIEEKKSIDMIKIVKSGPLGARMGKKVCKRESKNVKKGPN